MSERQEQEGQGEGTEAETGAESPAGEEERPEAEEAEAPPTAEAAAAAAPPRPKARGAYWLGSLALLLVLAAAGAGGYGYWRLERSLEETQAEVAAQAERQGRVRQTLKDLRGEIQGIGQEQEDLVGRSGRLEQRLDSVQGAISDLIARLEGGPSYWRLERVETLLLAADRIARLEGDPKAAYAALSSADTLLRELKDPGWLEVRRAVQSAMSRLEQAPDPDIPGIAFRLVSLTEAALDLPLKGTRPKVPEVPQTPAEEPEAGGGLWGRVTGALSQFWADIKSLVRLRRSGEDIQPLLPPDKSAFLRHNLVLNLQAARLAALRGEASLYSQSLTEARNWVQRFFQADTAEVQGMLNALEELTERPVARKLPELAEPLRTFRQVRKEREG